MSQGWPQQIPPQLREAHLSVRPSFVRMALPVCVNDRGSLPHFEPRHMNWACGVVQRESVTNHPCGQISAINQGASAESNAWVVRANPQSLTSLAGSHGHWRKRNSEMKLVEKEAILKTLHRSTHIIRLILKKNKKENRRNSQIWHTLKRYHEEKVLNGKMERQNSLKKILSNFALRSRQEIATIYATHPIRRDILCRVQIYGLLPLTTPNSKKNKINISAT